MIYYVRVDESTWPVDISTSDEDSAEWVLRYGSAERREDQRLAVASILSAYADLTRPDISLVDATAKLRRIRKARATLQ